MRRTGLAAAVDALALRVEVEVLRERVAAILLLVEPVVDDCDYRHGCPDVLAALDALQPAAVAEEVAARIARRETST